MAAAQRALATRARLLTAPITALGSFRTFTEAALDSTEDESLSEFRESVRSFAQEVIAPLAADIDRANNFPSHIDLWRELGNFGLHGEVEFVTLS